MMHSLLENSKDSSRITCSLHSLLGTMTEWAACYYLHEEYLPRFLPVLPPSIHDMLPLQSGFVKRDPKINARQIQGGQVGWVRSLSHKPEPRQTYRRKKSRRCLGIPKDTGTFMLSLWIRARTDWIQDILADYKGSCVDPCDIRLMLPSFPIGYCMYCMYMRFIIQHNTRVLTLFFATHAQMATPK